MLKEDLKYKLISVLELCKIHDERMQYALDYLQAMFPLNSESYKELSKEQISHSDQLIHRFSLLQDTIGNKLFPLVLHGLGEYSHDMPFIDMLNKLEKVSVIDSTEDWLSPREIRNIVTHEYPDNEKEIIDGLNELNEQSQYLSIALNKLLAYINKRKWL